MKPTDKQRKTDYGEFALAACAAIIFFVLMIRCRYGFANLDESFYLTVPYRLCQGDALFADEWHLSQMAGLLLYPLMKVYLVFAGGTEGISLAFRYLYTILHSAAAVFLYYRLRPHHKWGAAASALLFMIYVPFGIPALSYNSMGSDLLVLSAVVVLTARKYPVLQYILAGVMFAGAVLCCPYLIIAWAVYAAAAVVTLVLRKRLQPDDAPKPLYLRAVWFTVGCGILAVILLLFVISRCSIADVTAAFPEIFNDPEHTEFSLWAKLKSYFHSYGMSKPQFRCLWWFHVVLILAAATDKTRREHRSLYVMLSLIAAAAQIILLLIYKPYINHLMMPLNMTALVCRMVFPEDKRIRDAFRCIWIPGMIYTFALHMGSNQNYYAIFSAGAAVLVGSAFMIVIAVEILYRAHAGQKLRFGILAVALAVGLLQAGSTLYLRWNDVFWDGKIKAQTELVTEGPSKGLRITAGSLQNYTTMCNAAAQADALAPDAKSILFLSEKTYAYLIESDKTNSAFSAWLGTNINEASVARLHAYYELRPDKIPDLIVIEPTLTGLAPLLIDIAPYRVETVSGSYEVLIRENV